MIDLNPLHILAIDDETGVLDSIAAVVGSVWPEARFVTAEDGHRGLQLARDERPDVILLDLVLPSLSGIAVCRRLKDDPSLRDTPVVVMTGSNSDRDHRRGAVEAGADGFLLKPFDASELEVMIRSMTRLFRSLTVERSVQQHLSTIVEQRTEELRKELEERRDVEERLRQSEARYRLLVERSRDILYTVDAKGILHYVSPAIRNVLGLDPAALVGRSFTDHVNPEDLPLVMDVLRRSFMEGFRSNGTEFRIRHADGSWRWLFARGEAVEATEISPKVFMGLAHDVTERRRSDEALTASEERYRQLFEAESDAILLIENSTGRILEANSAAAQLYGRTREELLMLRNTDLSAEEGETRRVTQETPVEIERVVTIPLRYHRRADGSIVPVEITGRFFMWNGRAVHIAAIRDITQRLKAEERMRTTQAELSRALDLANRSRQALLSMVEDVRLSKTRLEESEERLRLALSAARQGIFDLDLRTGDAKVSPEYASMLGYDPAEFRETNASWLERLHPDERQQVGEVYRRYVDGEIPEYRVEFRQRCADGSWKWILSVGRIIEWDEVGGPIRMLGSHTDIHAMKVMEEQLRAAAEQTKSLLRKLQDVREQERRDLARELHDELGQELTAIKMDLRLLERALEEPVSTQKAERLAVRIESLRALGDRAIMTTRQLTTRLRPEVLDRLGFGQAVTWFAHQWHERFGIACSVEIDHSLQSIDDPTATTLFRVVQEGLNNIVKHAGATNVSVSAQRLDGHCRLEISDNGVGFSPGRARSDCFGLLGLQERVDALGGMLEIRSVDGMGTRLSVVVPVPSSEDDRTAGIQSAGTTETVSSILRHEKVHRRDTVSLSRSQD